MAETRQAPILLRHIRRLAGADGLAHLTDRELLRRFSVGRDEAAFAALVRRHGSMVLHVGQRVLHNVHDAEDAFQATFLLLTRKAASLRWHESVGNWLYQAAYRIALKAKTSAARRSLKEARAAERAPVESRDDLSWREVEALLDEELQRLPVKYRVPLMFCYLEGSTRDEAAQQLGWSLSTFKRCLERGRELLRQRLVRRGLTLSAALFAPMLTQSTTKAALAPGLVQATVRSALQLAAGGSATGSVSANVAALVDAATKSLSVLKLKTAVMLLLGVCVLGAGAGVLTHMTRAENHAPQEPKEPQKPAAQAKPPETRQSRTDRFGDAMPLGAIARLGTTRFRHDGLANSAFVGDGKIVATAGAGSVRFWETASGRLLRQVKGDFNPAALTSSPDGKWLAALEDRSITIREVPSGRLLRRWDAPGKWPYLGIPLAFSPDGKVLVVGGYGTVRLWDATTGNEIRRLEAHVNGTHIALFASKGARLVTTGYNKITVDEICHWDLDTGKLLKHVEIGTRAFSRRALRISHDGRWVAMAPHSRDAVRILDAETGKERCRLQGEKTVAGHWLAFSPDDRLLVTHWTEEGEDSASVSFWDTETGKLVRRFSIPLRVAEYLQLAPDGRTILTNNRSLLKLWDATTGKPLQEWPAHEALISNLHYSSDGGSLISASYDGTTRIWNAATGQQQRQLRISGFPDRLLPGGRAILSNGPPGAITLWDLETEKLLRRFPLEEKPEMVQVGDRIRPNSYFARLLGLSSDGRTVTAFGTRAGINKPETLQYSVWDFNTGRLISRRPEDSGFWPVIFSPDGKLAAGTYLQSVVKEGGAELNGPKSIVVLEVISGRQLLSLPQPDQWSGAVAFSPDGQALLTQTSQEFREADKQGIGKHTLHLWELRSAKERLTILGEKSGLESRHVRIAFSADGRTLATTREDGTIQLWDMVTGKELLHYSGYDAQVSCLAISPDGKTLATGHNDSTILVWDIAPATRPGAAKAAGDPKDLESWGDDLAGSDARKAHTAIWELTDRPRQAVPLLRNRLKAASGMPPDQLRQLLRDLDNTEFQTREAATNQLRKFAHDVEPALQEALKVSTSPEQRRRIEALLAAPRVVPAGDELRQLRALEVLEHIGTPAARELLKTLANGASEARLTQEAKAALERLGKRNARD